MVFIRGLRWDGWNVAHGARHHVLPEEVEEVCHGAPLVLQSFRGRIILIGPTRSNKMLAVVLYPEGSGVYYPLTARPASRKERRLYQEGREAEEE